MAHNAWARGSVNVFNLSLYNAPVYWGGCGGDYRTLKMTKKELRKEQTNRFIEKTIITTDLLLSSYLYYKSYTP